jgi:SNF2 family DNA or RNA helicase
MTPDEIQEFLREHPGIVSAQFSNKVGETSNEDFNIPAPEGESYFPFQLDGIRYAVKHVNTLNADQPGSGKTIQSVGLSNALPEIRKILIIPPAFLKSLWRREWIKWCVKRLSVGIVSGKDGVFPNTDVVIINYDILKYYRTELRSCVWDLLIVDEVHKLKSKKADRTLEAFGGIKRNSEKKIIDRTTPIPAKRCLCLSGTPSPNGKPKELWNIIQHLDPGGLGADWFKFAKRYCKLFEIKNAAGQRIGFKWDGVDNLEELQQIMSERFMIRRLKKDILKQLPLKRRMIIPIEPGIRDLKNIQKELQEFDSYAGGDESVLFDMPSFGDFSKRMLETGLRMVKPAIEVIESDLEENDKIFVMCYHKEVAEKIYEHFKQSSVLITGDIAPDKRLGLIDQFQTDSKITIVVGTLGAAGTGLTATAASLMIFPERSWVPGDVEQGEDRINRIGSTKTSLYKHLVLEGSLAERQVQALIKKQDNADRMLDSV